MTGTLGRLTTALADRYVIERELGAGGMATVYLAHDVRHDRKVALKVLRPELAAILGGSRFLQEIRTTANLQHPHILSLFDSGEADGTVYYVMPYVAGESLRDRLEREKQLPVEVAVRIAQEVASALDYAHRHNVVHRDIKPENILLHDGTALVADFGIALAASRSDGGTRMTETGMSLGTPHYMAPEQAMGEREITPRADVYALGCVLYEMLSGEPPFTGPTAQAIIARVMTEEPRSLTLQRHTVPAHVDAVVRRALEKLPADRFQSASELADALERPAATLIEPALARAVPQPLRRWRMAVPWAVAAAGIAAAAWGFSRGGARPASWERVVLGDSLVLQVQFPTFAVSPDGASLVFKEDAQNGRLWIKRRDALDPTPLAGTERGQNPAFSPDGEWIMYVADGRLRKVRTAGGAAITLADSAAAGYGGATWLDDGTIIFVPPTLDGLLQVSADGGAATRVLEAGTELAGLGVGYPRALPRGRGVLFQGCSSGCITMTVFALDLRTRQVKQLLADAASAWVLPDGRLLYVRSDGVGLVAPFDLDRLEVTGPAVPVIENVFVAAGNAQLALSAGGTLVYLEGNALSADNTIARVGRDGTRAPIDTSWYGPFAAPSLSPDGRRIAVGSGAATGELNIWIKTLDRGPFTRLSFAGRDRRPVWSRDGRMIAFVRDTLNTSIVVGRRVDGSGDDVVLARLDRQVQEVAWSPDGAWLVLRTDNATAGAGDLVGVRLRGDTTPVPLVASPFTELQPEVSPDGRWLAYASNESGINQVYVRPFPETGRGRWQVSNNGGSQPRWTKGGRELVFLAESGQLVAARLAGGPVFDVRELTPLFDYRGFVWDGFHQSYAVTPDGLTFYAVSIRAADGIGRTPRVVRVENWPADLATRLAR